MPERNHRIFFFTVIGFSLVIGYLLLRPYLPLVAMAFVIALLYKPLYNKVLNRTKSKGLASALTITTVYLTIIIPLIFLVSVIAAQVLSLRDDIRVWSQSQEEISLNTAVIRVNEKLDRFGLSDEYRLETSDIVNFTQKAITPFGSFALSNAISVSNTALGLISVVIIFTMVLSGILANKEKIRLLFRQLSPLDDDIDGLYMKRLGDMSIAMVKGTFVIAILNALTTGFFLWIAGVPYVVFWILISAFVSLIPLGAGIVSLPIGVILILTGNVWQGLLQIISYVVVVSNIDNILRPKLVPKDSGLHPALTILSIFGGVKLFGFFGIIFGPMVMIFIITTLEVYIKYYRNKA